MIVLNGTRAATPERHQTTVIRTLLTKWTTCFGGTMLGMLGFAALATPRSFRVVPRVLSAKVFILSLTERETRRVDPYGQSAGAHCGLPEPRLPENVRYLGKIPKRPKAVVGAIEESPV